MPTTNYSRGREAEWRARDELIAEGFHVIRASSSKGLWDIVAVHDFTLLLISLKSTGKESYAKTYVRSETRRLACIATPENCYQQVWVWLKGKGWYAKVTIDRPTIKSDLPSKPDTV